MPTTSQLVRKGRVSPKKKLATPGLKSGKGRKKKVAAPQRRGACTRGYTTTPKKRKSARRRSPGPSPRPGPDPPLQARPAGDQQGDARRQEVDRRADRLRRARAAR